MWQISLAYMETYVQGRRRKRIQKPRRAKFQSVVQVHRDDESSFISDDSTTSASSVEQQHHHNASEQSSEFKSSTNASRPARKDSPVNPNSKTESPCLAQLGRHPSEPTKNQSAISTNPNDSGLKARASKRPHAAEY